MDNLDDKLDSALRKWAEENSASAERLTALQVRTACHLISGDKSLSGAGPRHSTKWPRALVAYRTLATAAALLISVTAAIWIASRPGDGLAPPEGNSAGLPPAAVNFAAAEIAEKGRLLAELRSLFGDRFGWMAESGEHVQLGVSDESVTAEGPYLAIRWVLVRRGRAESEWQKTWTIDVMARNERVIHINELPDQAGALVIWGFVLPDGNVAVDVDADLSSFGDLRTEGSVVARPGEPTELFLLSEGDFEYRIYQTVLLVSDNVT
jgi:hypothetical protein